jgi:hypothetical protein
MGAEYRHNGHDDEQGRPGAVEDQEAAADVSFSAPVRPATP